MFPVYDFLNILKVGRYCAFNQGIISRLIPGRGCFDNAPPELGGKSTSIPVPPSPHPLRFHIVFNIILSKSSINRTSSVLDTVRRGSIDVSPGGVVCQRPPPVK